MKTLPIPLRLQLLLAAGCLLFLSACTAPPRAGKIQVMSWPEGEIYVDGKPTGIQTPCYLRLTYAEEKHTVSVTADGTTLGEETVVRMYYTYLGDGLFDESGWLGSISGHSPAYILFVAASPVMYPLYLLDRKRWPWWEPSSLWFGDYGKFNENWRIVYDKLHH